jgi:hypothetical protein
MGGSSLNIIFTETLRKMDFDFNKMTACDEPFYRVVPDKVADPIGRVCLPVTFGIKENFRTEYLTFEVADFRSSYHAILGRPMLAKFMAIPHHTYLIMKMPAPNGILSVLGDIMVSYNCESSTVELAKDSAYKANGHGRSGRQDGPNHSRGARAESHSHNLGPKPCCEESLPRCNTLKFHH